MPPLHRPHLLDPTNTDDADVLARLRSDGSLEFVDGLEAQRAALRQLRPAPEPDLLAETPRWVHYPWRRTVVAVLGPRAFRRVRLDRNRNLVTTDEQQQLAGVRVGVVGLSVGHAVAHTLAAQGVCGLLRLVDFDSIELTNLNRVPATVFDLGLNKAVVAARRIAELDPYLTVEVMPTGLSAATVGQFLDGLDVVAEECDSLDVKLLLREAARERRLPVLTATSDRGLLDVERFDLHPTRPPLHGLLGDVAAAELSRLDSAEKVPYVLRLHDAGQSSARAVASLAEIGYSLSTWPQLAGDVAVGGATIAEAVRRIGLGEPLPSGRVCVDVYAALDDVSEPQRPGDDRRAPQPGPSDAAADGADAADVAAAVADVVAAAANRAPSGGNSQPWRLVTGHDSVRIRLAPRFPAAMDVGSRASAVAVGAAAFNARVAAAAHGVLGDVTLDPGGVDSPLEVVVHLDGSDDHGLSQLYPAMLERETNRHHGAATALGEDVAAALTSAAAAEGATLRLLTSRDDVSAAARLLADAERIRYLTPRLHADMVAEMCWDGVGDTGIDVDSLEMGDGHRAVLALLRRPDVMARLDAWDGGDALGADTRSRVESSSAVATVCVRGHALADYVRGGSAVEAVWVTAQRLGVAVQPISPVFLYAREPGELARLSPRHATALDRLNTDLHALVGTDSGEAHVLVMRLFAGPRPSVRSRRRRDTISALTP